jgi:hypothetical protein
MPYYRLRCRAVLAPHVITELFRRGVYWARGGPTWADTQRHRHHLRIEAESEAQAIEQARRQVEEAGGADIAELAVVGSDSRLETARLRE